MNHKNLSANMKKLFEKLGVKEIVRAGKPYYAAFDYGCFCRVVAPNKIKPLRENGKYYKTVKLKQEDGSFQHEKVHRAMMQAAGYNIEGLDVHHDTGDPSDNRLKVLTPDTKKAHRYLHKIKSKDPELYAAMLQELKKEAEITRDSKKIKRHRSLIMKQNYP